MPEKRSVSELIGETLREVGILVLVFVPLEGYKGTSWPRVELVLWVAGTLVIATIFIAIGILLERSGPS